jgi:hypothetical protein
VGSFFLWLSPWNEETFSGSPSFQKTFAHSLTQVSLAHSRPLRIWGLITGKGDGISSRAIRPIPEHCARSGSLSSEKGSSLSKIGTVCVNPGLRVCQASALLRSYNLIYKIGILFGREKGKWALRSWVEEAIVSSVRRDPNLHGQTQESLCLIAILLLILPKSLIGRI